VTLNKINASLNSMKWPFYLTKFITAFFGITPPRPEHEARYGYIVLGLFLATMIGIAVAVKVLMPLVLGR